MNIKFINMKWTKQSSREWQVKVSSIVFSCAAHYLRYVFVAHPFCLQNNIFGLLEVVQQKMNQFGSVLFFLQVLQVSSLSHCRQQSFNYHRQLL